MARIVPATPPVPTYGMDPSPADKRRSLLATAIMAPQAPMPASGYSRAVQQAVAATEPQAQHQGILASAVAMPSASATIGDDGTLARLGEQIGSAQVKRPSFFEQGGVGRKILQGIGDFALNMSASQGDPVSMMTLRNRAEHASQRGLWARQDAQRQEDRRWQVEDRDAKANAPQYFNAGRDRVRLDPVTGASEVVYDAPEDYESYADTLGLHPGDEGYGGAVQDYVLRGNGPTSQAARQALETARATERLRLRATPTYAQTHPTPRRSGGGGSGAPKSTSAVVAPILLKMARGGTLTPGEQQALAYGRSGGRGGGRGASLPVVSSPAEAAKLPSGTRFKTPDGRTKVAP